MRPRILLVDDDPTLLTVGEVELDSLGYDVTVAKDGTAAFSELETKQFDIVVSDFEMPGASGLDLLRWVRTSKDPQIAKLPVVVVTSRNDNDAVRATFDARATTYMQKPINWLNLDQQLQFVLRAEDDKRELEAARDAANRAADTQRSLMMVLRHELKTPLHIIMGYTDILRGETNPDTVAEHLSHVNEAADALNSRLSKVFQYSDLCEGGEQPPHASANLREIVGAANRALADKTEARGVKVSVDVNAEMELNADYRLLLLAMGELLTNALTASPDGGEISVTGLEQDKVFALVISDQGDGFPDEKREILLDAFSQSDAGLRRVSEGLGLGLAIVGEVLKLHGGTVRLENAPDGGGRVILIFPRGEEDSVRQVA